MSIQLSTTPHNMRRAMRFLVTLATLSMSLFASEPAFGQGAVTVLPHGGAGHAGPATCLILERAGAVDKVTSRVLSLGIHEKQFQYVEGKLPEGFRFHDKLTARDVSDLQARGSEVVIVNSDLMPDELQQGRDYCRAEHSRPQFKPVRLKLRSLLLHPEVTLSLTENLSAVPRHL